MNETKLSLFAIGLSLNLLCGCGDSDPLANADAVVTNYADNVHRGYEDVLSSAKALQSAVQAFVDAPSQQTQKAAKDAWIAARLPYGPTEAFRFYGGPIDNEDSGPEGFVNAWPLDENFIDYTRDDENAGIINRSDLFPQISKEVLRAQNELGGEKNIATGYHAIEFLLWGQDDLDPMQPSAGSRPFSDFVSGAAGSAKNQERRAAYLKTLSDLLIEDLTPIEEAWHPGQENYRKAFLSDKKQALTRMLTGIGSLANAELSGERMTVAFKNRSQEDEHSCFSDNTSADLLGNGLGLAFVWRGSWNDKDGPGIDDLVREQDAALADQIDADMSAMLDALKALEKTPFDTAIASPDGSPERTRVLDAINAVKKVAGDIVPAGEVLGLSFQVENPSESL